MADKKLLVADDSLTIQKVIRLALANEGYEIQAVSDGNDAIQQISIFRPDIVLMDVSLPSKTAFEIKTEMNALADLQSTRTVLMSSAFEQVDEARATEVHFDGRLVKPFDPAHLRKVLTQVMESPQESPVLSPDLWSKEENAPDPDIRELTESTIKMSGLDDIEWNVNDSSIMKTKSEATARFSQYSDQEPHIEPHKNMMDMDGVTLKLEPEQTPPEVTALNQAPPSTGSPPIQAVDAEATLIPPDQMEEIISKQVGATIERLAKKILPEVAERIIKEEIHKLLGSPPSNHP